MPQTQPTPAPVTELKASAHLMLLDPGVFCVFNTPGVTPPDPKTGLPGVRLSPAPATGGLSGHVSLSGFSEDGWLDGGEGAALVRVTGGPAQILVTVYQSTDGAHEPPKLQVLRLTEAVAAAPPAAAAAPAGQSQAPQAQAPGSAGPFEVAAHIYGRGDVAGRLGEWMGERGSKRWVEGFGLQPARGVPPAELEYQAVLGRGWLSPWVEGGQFCGSRGMSLPILGLRVRLKGNAAQHFTAVVAATFVDGTQIGPVGDGEPCEAPSLAALEAFVVVLQPKQVAMAPARTATQPAVPAAAPAPARQQPKTPVAPSKPPVKVSGKPTAKPAARPTEAAVNTPVVTKPAVTKSVVPKSVVAKSGVPKSVVVPKSGRSKR